MSGWLARIGTAVALILVIGCQQNPYGAPPPPGAMAPNAPPGSFPPTAMSPVPMNAAAVQLGEIKARMAKLDESNRDLHTKVAQYERQMGVMQDELNLARERLRETASQLREAQVARQEAENRVQTLQASVRHRGGAILRANNSLKQSLEMIDLNIDGVDVRQDGDVIRIAVPADQLFAYGSTTLHPQATRLLTPVALAIRTHYPQQRVGIEGHIDGTPGIRPDSLHQITSAQAVAVFQFLTSQGLPPQQLHTMAHGANHPRVSNATEQGRAENRRIEFVVYPENF